MLYLFNLAAAYRLPLVFPLLIDQDTLQMNIFPSNKLAIRPVCGYLCLCCLFCGLLLVSKTSWSVDTSLSAARIDKVTLLSTYYFAIRNYTPPLRVSLKSPEEKMARDTPEGAALAHYKFMLTGNFESWLSNWDESSRVAIIERNRKKNRDAEFWRKAWRKVVSGYSEFLLTRRVDTKGFVIIEFRGVSEDKKKDDLVLNVALRSDEAGIWRPTNSFASDPVFLYWSNPAIVVERMVREPPQL